VAVQNEFQTRNAELAENRRMEFRIGINLGDVIDEEDRIYGDGVNVAARLEALADPGGVCVSKTAFDQIETKLPLGYEYLGEQPVKNIPKPVGAYRVLMRPDAAGKVIGEKRLKPGQRRQATIAGLVAFLLVVGALTIWNIYVRAPQVEPGSMKKKEHHMPDTPLITKTSELEAEKKRLADKVARVKSDRHEREQLKALIKEKKEIEAELNRLKVEKKTIETNRRKELEIQTKGDEKQKLAKIPKEFSAGVETRPSPGPPYNMAIFPWMLQNEANFYLSHALNSLIDDIKRKDKLTLKLSFYKIGLTPGVKKIDDSVINSNTVDDLWLKKSSSQKNKPNVKLVCQIGSKLNVDGVLMLYFDVKKLHVEIYVKKIIIYLIDIKTGKLLSERNIMGFSLYQGNFNDELASLLSTIVNRYLKLQTG
jgi:hypothetical protein